MDVPPRPSVPVRSMSNALVGALGTKQVNTTACRKQQCKKTNSRPSLRGWDVVLGWGLVGLILPKFKFSYVPAYRKKKKEEEIVNNTDNNCLRGTEVGKISRACAVN